MEFANSTKNAEKQDMVEKDILVFRRKFDTSKSYD